MELMKKVFLLAGGVILLLATAFLLFKSLPFKVLGKRTGPTPTLLYTPTPSLKEVVQEDTNFQIVQSFAQNCPTYQFDGEGLELSSFEKLKCLNCFRYEFFFTSRHGGYGDRSGMMTTQAITPHKIAITVQNGQVTQALTDGKYDEIRGKLVLP